MTEQNKGYNDSDHHQSGVEYYLRSAELGFTEGKNGFDQSFSRQKNDIGDDFEIDAKSQNHTSEQKKDQGNPVICGMNMLQQFHGAVDKESKEHRYGNLQQADFLKGASQNQNLQHYKDETKGNGELSQTKRKSKAQNIGNAGDG